MNTKANKFGGPKARKKEAVKNRFSMEEMKKTSHLVDEKKEAPKKTKKKTPLKQFSLRIPIDLYEDLSFVVFASRDLVMDIGNVAIRKEADKKLGELEILHGTEGLKSRSLKSRFSAIDNPISGPLPNVSTFQFSIHLIPETAWKAG